MRLFSVQAKAPGKSLRTGNIRFAINVHTFVTFITKRHIFKANFRKTTSSLRYERRTFKVPRSGNAKLTFKVP